MSRNHVAVLLGLGSGLTACDTAPSGAPTGPGTETAQPAETPVQPHAAASYPVTYLNKRGGAAYDVNNLGQVVGTYQGSTGSRAFIWQNGVLKDLGTLGGDFGVAYAINDAGQVAGESSTPSEAQIHGFVWQNGVMQDVGTFGASGALGAPGSEALGLNGKGQVVGYALTATFNARAFLWENGAKRRLTGLEKVYSKAYGIDGAGSIVGEFGPQATPRAFLWKAGVLTPLGTLGGSTSRAAAVSGGRIVGQAATASGTTRAFLWQNGVMKDLGTLGGANSAATAMNGKGQIVGYSETSAGTVHAFIWENGVMTDVGVGLARGINQDGWIVGQKIDPLVSGHGGYLPVLWKPSDAPPPPPPPPGAVTVGSNFFISNRNGSTNPAVDTIPVGGKITWTWISGAAARHSVQSIGSPSFPSSAIMSGKGTTYAVTFSKAGTYQYNCVVHPGVMTGRVVVK